MPSPFVLAKWEGLLLLAGSFGIVGWKLADGSIALDQLLEGDIRDTNNADGFSPYASAGRVQSFLVTVFVALYYLEQVIRNPTEFPKLPDALVGALAGSQVLYLAGKTQAMLLGRLRGFFR